MGKNTKLTPEIVQYITDNIGLYGTVSQLLVNLNIENETNFSYKELDKIIRDLNLKNSFGEVCESNSVNFSITEIKYLETMTHNRKIDSVELLMNKFNKKFNCNWVLNSFTQALKVYDMYRHIINRGVVNNKGIIKFNSSHNDWIMMNFYDYYTLDELVDAFNVEFDCKLSSKNFYKNMNYPYLIYMIRNNYFSGKDGKKPNFIIDDCRNDGELIMLEFIRVVTERVGDVDTAINRCIRLLELEKKRRKDVILQKE